MPSNIHVFVRWKEPSVFAGDDAQCIITFKNIADELADLASDSRGGKARKDSVNGVHSRRLSQGGLFSSTASSPFSSPRGNFPERRHRVSASLSVTPSSATFPRTPSWASQDGSSTRPTQRHQRSVSVMSLGGNEQIADVSTARMLPPTQPPKRPASHGRSASLQVLSRGPSSSEDLYKSGTRRQAPNRQSSLSHVDAARQGLQVPTRPHRRGSGQRSPSMSPSNSNPSTRVPSPNSGDFKFPSTAGNGNGSSTPESDASRNSARRSNSRGMSSLAYLKRKNSPSLSSQIPGTNRVISGASIDESVRSSGEFYATSNQSTDTMASEQVPLASQRLLLSHSRMPSRATVVQRSSHPETLLMGYAQIAATFSVDGSLVDQSPFEEVKRKGFMGGQGGGGVVGVEKRKSVGGFLGGFNLSSIGESLSGLLGPQDLSSTKEMKGAISSKSIPLLSTPQSLLFVDLKLKPGDEKSFSYTYKLPRGLPASYKGKAIKITYNLVIGTQFAVVERDMQRVRSVNVPLRVFSGVNSDGDILGHDLLHPYVVMRDTAKIESLDDPVKAKAGAPAIRDQDTFGSDFSAYTRNLLGKRFRRQSSGATLDDAAIFAGREQDGSTHQSRDLIRQAILHSNQTAESDRSPNRFEIARNGRFIGVVVLNRPYHRIGETVTATIDFTNSEVSTLSLRCMLESCESVEPSLALRSPASITRATKKVYAFQAENTLYSQRAVFCPPIPVSATPTLFTSGINLNWQLRFEFATAKASSEASAEDASPSLKLDLLEEIGSDDRGVSKAALETLSCDTFEVTIPLTVYGDVFKDTEEEEIVGLPI